MEPTSALDRLDLVYYWVSDLSRAVAFYQEVLGLTLLRRDDPRWAEFDAGGRRFALHSAADGQPITPGGATAVFAVQDLDRAKRDLQSKGVAFGFEGGVAGYGRFATLHDPDGNPVELIEYTT